MITWTEQDANDTIQAVLKRSTTDPEFRQLALSDPAAAVKAETGKELPEGFSVKVVDNAGANLTLVLPDFVGSGELSDAELEEVAGGKRRRHCIQETGANTSRGGHYTYDKGPTPAKF